MRFETMRAEQARDLLRTGNRPVTKKADPADGGLEFRSTEAD